MTKLLGDADKLKVDAETRSLELEDKFNAVTTTAGELATELARVTMRLGVKEAQILQQRDLYAQKQMELVKLQKEHQVVKSTHLNVVAERDAALLKVRTQGDETKSLHYTINTWQQRYKLLEQELGMIAELKEKKQSELEQETDKFYQYKQKMKNAELEMDQLREDVDKLRADIKIVIEERDELKQAKAALI